MSKLVLLVPLKPSTLSLQDLIHERLTTSCLDSTRHHISRALYVPVRGRTHKPSECSARRMFDLVQRLAGWETLMLRRMSSGSALFASMAMPVTMLGASKNAEEPVELLKARSLEGIKRCDACVTCHIRYPAMIKVNIDRLIIGRDTGILRESINCVNY